ncbi:UDPGP type 1 family protein [uncultured Candidatus Kuenenia sp.]|uniref:UDPGP type 1 family protein n=1 Tax=uncultured Candidatus Kuenenia sp. TaxID=1048336 RepID=UPI0002F08D01|nr:UDPGP type 1 family protein [uncultured Candidatus Kuenenia sp.]
MNTVNKDHIEKAYPDYKHLIEKAFQTGQYHIFSWWNEITTAEKLHLLKQISSIDFTLLQKLFHESFISASDMFQKNLQPPPIIGIPENITGKKAAEKAKQVGEESLCNGEIAILTVAGGQGTRLGIDGPKGMLPISPINKKSIFQLHAEKIRALQTKYNAMFPWYIMTSETNDHDTQEFFRSNKFFGLDQQRVYFFTQRMIPTVDMNGKILMNAKSNIVMSPNGHGGTIIALQEKSIINDIKERGVRHIFYHQVDNVLIKMADPVFIGYHLMDGADVSSKVVKKRSPDEKVGVIVSLDGHLHVVEYSELSQEDKYAKNNDGTLKYNAGNIAIHIFSIAFLEKLFQMETYLPYHIAIKKVPFIDLNGNLITPKENNAIKFETFIFDVLKHVKNGVLMEVIRKEEFSPVKNAEGDDSPATAQQDMVNIFGQWLRKAGVAIPKDSNDNVKGLIEINPCFAFNEEDLIKNVDKDLEFRGFLNL